VVILKFIQALSYSFWTSWLWGWFTSYRSSIFRKSCLNFWI